MQEQFVSEMCTPLGSDRAWFTQRSSNLPSRHRICHPR